MIKQENEKNLFFHLLPVVMNYGSIFFIHGKNIRPPVNSVRMDESTWKNERIGPQAPRNYC
jgi:hypothetical protein